MRRLLTLLICCPGLAFAQDQAFTYTLPPPAWQSINFDTAMNRLHFNRLAQNSPADEPKGTSAGDARKDTTRQAKPQSVQQQLAAGYPAPQRARAEHLFSDMLAAHGAVEARFRLPKGDVAGAMAMFVMGSHMAYRNVDFSAVGYEALVGQLDAAIRANERYAGVPAAQRQQLHERLAIAGMYMATLRTALKDRPASPEFRAVQQTAKHYLEGFMKVDADEIRLGERGLLPP
jgi:hypothetical protein